MSKYITPRFDFSGPIALEGDGQEHTIHRIANNNLAPVKFNEYERVMVTIGEAIGDYQLSDTIPGSPDVIGGAIRRLYELMVLNLALKVAKAGDTMSGALVISGTGTMLDITGDQYISGSVTIDNDSDLTVDGSINITGNYTTTNRDISTPGKVAARAINIEWATGRLYRIGDLVVQDQRLYRCKKQHTSGVFVEDYFLNWDIAGADGSTEHHVYLSSHGFIPGNVLRYDSNVHPNGYIKAQADEIDTLGQFIVTRVLDNDNFIISQGGYFEDTTYTVNFTPNTWYYTSDTAAGVLTSTEPYLSNPMVYAISENEGFVIGYRPNLGTSIHLDEYIATTDQTDFILSDVPFHDDYMFVSIDGVIQNTGAYSWLDNVLTLAHPLPGGERVRVQMFRNLTVPENTMMKTDEFTVVSNGETEFTLSYAPISKEYMVVSVNGILQHDSSFSIANNIITFTYGLSAGNSVRVQQVMSMNVIDAIRSSFRVDTISAYNNPGSGAVTFNDDVYIRQDKGLYVGDNALEVDSLSGVVSVGQSNRLLVGDTTLSVDTTSGVVSIGQGSDLYIGTDTLETDSMSGIVHIKTVSVTGDSGGTSGSVSFSNSSDLTGNSTGIGTIKFKDGTTRDSVGFIKIYVDTVPYYIPLFDEII